jgi:hypothetical protein
MTDSVKELIAMAEGNIPGFGNPVTAVIGVIAEIVKFLFGLGSNMKSFVHDVTLSLKLAWGTMAGPILGAFDLIKGAIVGLIQRIKKIIEVLQEKIGKVLGPIIKYGKQVRDLWDHLFSKYIAPILNAIQHVRQTLAIFKVFHLKFADALDKRLAKLEGDIAKPFLIVKQKINQILSVLELWSDPFGFLTGNAIWRGLTSTIAGLRGLILGFNFSPTLPAPSRPSAKDLYADSSKQWGSTFKAWTTGNLSEDEKRWSDEHGQLFR